MFSTSLEFNVIIIMITTLRTKYDLHVAYRRERRNTYIHNSNRKCGNIHTIRIKTEALVIASKQIRTHPSGEKRNVCTTLGLKT